MNRYYTVIHTEHSKTLRFKTLAFISLKKKMQCDSTSILSVNQEGGQTPGGCDLKISLRAASPSDWPLQFLIRPLLTKPYNYLYTFFFIAHHRLSVLLWARRRLEPITQPEAQDTAHQSCIVRLCVCLHPCVSERERKRESEQHTVRWMQPEAVLILRAPQEAAGRRPCS